jgi:hypothetical protein
MNPLSKTKPTRAPAGPSDPSGPSDSSDSPDTVNLFKPLKCPDPIPSVAKNSTEASLDKPLFFKQILSGLQASL